MSEYINKFQLIKMFSENVLFSLPQCIFLFYIKLCLTSWYQYWFLPAYAISVTIWWIHTWKYQDRISRKHLSSIENKYKNLQVEFELGMFVFTSYILPSELTLHLGPFQDFKNSVFELNLSLVLLSFRSGIKIDPV